MLSSCIVIQREMRNPYKNQLVQENDILIMLIKSNVDLVFPPLARTFDGNIRNLVFHRKKHLQISFKFMGKIVGTRKNIIGVFIFDQQYPKKLEDAFTSKPITVLTIYYQSIK